MPFYDLEETEDDLQQIAAERYKTPRPGQSLPHPEFFQRYAILSPWYRPLRKLPPSLDWSKPAPLLRRTK